MNALGNDSIFKKKNLIPIHNSKQEINSATKEMIDKVIFNKNISSENVYQKKIKEIIKNCAYRQAGIRLESCRHKPKFSAK